MVRHEWDIYLNPWWGYEFQLPKAHYLCEEFSHTLGEPYVEKHFFSYPKLVWGHGDLAMTFRPSISVNVSGTNGKTWFHLWLPWRSPDYNLAKSSGRESLTNANIIDSDVDFNEDYIDFQLYLDFFQHGPKKRIMAYV